MKIKLLISLALASAAYVGAMTSENDSCPVNQDSVQVNADSAQLSDPAQGYIFDRDTTGWIVNSCPSTSIILGYVDVYGNATKLIPKLNKPIRWNVCPSGYSSNSSLFLKILLFYHLLLFFQYKIIQKILKLNKIESILNNTWL